MNDRFGISAALKAFPGTLVNGFMAGIFIGIAGTVFLAVPAPELGAFLFGFGLLTILSYQFKLYTGVVGYLANQGCRFPGYLVTLAGVWLGNLAGCFVLGCLVRSSRIVRGAAFLPRVEGMCAAKLADNFTSLLILSFICGILMYIAAETFRRKELHGAVRTVTVFLCVAIFILSGCEHSIAGMYYFSAAGMWSRETLVCVGVMTLGNSLGGMLVPLADKLRPAVNL